VKVNKLIIYSKLDFIRKRYSLLLSSLENSIAAGNKNSRNPMDVINFPFFNFSNKNFLNKIFQI